MTTRRHFVHSLGDPTFLPVHAMTQEDGSSDPKNAYFYLPLNLTGQTTCEHPSNFLKNKKALKKAF